MRRKHKVIASIGAAILLAVLGAMVVWAYVINPRPSLPEGYSLVRVHGSHVVLTRTTGEMPGLIVLGAPVKRYAVHRDLIVGFADERGDHPDDGFFVVNAKTHEVAEGLSEQKWVSLLRKNGIEKVPELTRASGRLW